MSTEKSRYNIKLNLEKTLAAGTERRRLTEQLVDIVSDIAADIRDEVEELDGITIDNHRIVCHTYRTNVANDQHLCIADAYGDVVSLETSPESSYYVHGDFGAPCEGASTAEFLWFANNIPAILSELQASETRAIAQLRESFDRLRAAATKEI